MIDAAWFVIGVCVGMMLGILLYHLKVLSDTAAVVPMLEDFRRGYDRLV